MSVRLTIAATAAATVVVGQPVLAATSSHHGKSVAIKGVSAPRHVKGVHLKVPAGVAPHATAINGLGKLHEHGGPITVALQLPAKPAMTVWRKAAPGTRAHAARAQAATIAASQHAVVRRANQLSSLHVLYRVQNLYDGVVVRVSQRQAASLLSIPGVSAVQRVTPAQLHDASSDALVGAPQAWQSNGGLTGQGETIGIIDTGVDYTHTDFGGDGNTAGNDSKVVGDSPDYPSAQVVGGYDFAGDAYDASTTAKATPQPDADPVDCNGHGTHVAGIAAGQGENANGTTFTGPYNSSVPLPTMRVSPGIAPQATLYALKIFGCSGSTVLVTQAIDWAMDPNNDGNFDDHLDVVNISVGSNWGSSSSPDAIAASNAVKAGVQVVTSAGNSGDVSYVSSTPGSSERAITVAASVDAGEQSDNMTFTPTGGSPTRYGGAYSTSYSWTTHPADITAPVYHPTTANRTGCAAYTGTDLALAPGTIVVLDWNPTNAATVPCGSVTRVTNAAAAGAVGAIFVEYGPTQSVNVTGSSTTQSIIITNAGNAIETAVPAGTVGGTASFSANDVKAGQINDAGRTDTVASYSSRGPTVATNSLKPDLSAPGDTVWSAAFGTGTKGISYNGTSMAAPHVAGAMALLAERHPSWSPEELKALVMNTADAELTYGRSGTGARISPVRQGSGRMDIPNALQSDVVAYDTDVPGSVSLSYGSVQVLGTQTATRTLKVVNNGDSDASYQLGIDQTTPVPGVSYSFPDGNHIIVPAHGSVTVPVLLTAVGSAMTNATDPNLDLKQTDSNLFRQKLSESAGLVTLTPENGTSGVPLHVAYLAVVRPASNMSTPATQLAFPDANPGGGGILLSGTGVNTSDGELSNVTPLQLMDTSPRDPSVPANVDLRATGLAATTSQVIFGINTYGQHAMPGYQEADLEVYLDPNNTGIYKYILFNTRYTTTSSLPTDVYVTGLYNTGTGVVTYANYLNNRDGSVPTALFNSDVMTMGTTLASIGLTGATKNLRYQTVTWHGGTKGEESPIHVVDLAHPGLDFSNGANNTLYRDLPGDGVPVAWNPSYYAAQHGLGVLLLHHFNQSGSTAQIIPAGPAVSSISVTPASPTIVKGTSQQLTATATYTDATTQDVTGLAHWSSDSSNATVGSDLADAGKVTGASAGGATITASLRGVDGSTPVTVTHGTLTSISVTPANASVAKGTTQQYTATGNYSTGDTEDLTSAVTWSTDDLATATIDSSGLLTGAGEGSTNVVASYGGKTGSTGVTVTAAALSSVTVSPSPASMAKGTQQQFSATGHFSDGTTQDVTSSATWSSTNTDAVTVDTTGLATAAGVGTSTVSAAYSGKSGDASVEVTAATLQSIAVTPPFAKLPVGLSRQFTATGTFSDASTQDLTNNVTWTSSRPSYASVSNAAGSEGLAQGLATGGARITATLGSVSGYTHLSVTPAVLTGLVVTDGSLITNGASPHSVVASLAKGDQRQLIATGTFSDGSMLDMTTQVTWSPSTGNPAALMSNASGSQGVVTGMHSGETTVHARSGKIDGTHTVTVSNAELRSISLSPANPSIAKGTTTRVVATGTYSDGHTGPLWSQVSWSSADPSTVSVSDDSPKKGTVTGVGVGSTTVTATVGGVQGSTTVTVTAATLKRLRVTPANSSTAAGTTRHLRATGIFTDASTQDLTSQVVWSSDAESVASVSNASGEQGLLYAVAPGTANITAALDSVTGSTGATVT
ncbi:MAG: Ig-like domain-containing protein [Frankiaceae bacterium]|nr:Ig-like domain-containing protein [Frankiaceae bacterium]